MISEELLFALLALLAFFSFATISAGEISDKSSAAFESLFSQSSFSRCAFLLNLYYSNQGNSLDAKECAFSSSVPEGSFPLFPKVSFFDSNFMYVEAGFHYA